MKKKCGEAMEFSKKLIALLLCCLCLLAAMPISAIAIETSAASVAEDTFPEEDGSETDPVEEPGTPPEEDEPVEDPEPPADEPVDEDDPVEDPETPPEDEDDSVGDPEPPADENEPVETPETPVDEGSIEAPKTPDADEDETTDEPEIILSLYDRLMACTSVEEVDAILDNLTEEEEAELDAFTEEQYADVEAHLTELGYYGTSTNADGRYYHLDMRVAAQVNVKVYNADGTITEETVSATLSNPTATIYNTGSKTWYTSGSGTDSSTGLKYWNIGFSSTVSTDENEYMQNSPDRQRTEFYNGDTVVLTYTLTYILNGETHTVPVEISYVFREDDNKCNSKNDSGTMRGFDYVATIDDVTTAFSASQLQISKAWNDNNNSKRPDHITVKVYQTVSGFKSEYMTLTLNKDKSSSSYAMASGVTADSDMVVTFSDNYGVSIVGLPANHWISSGGNYTYESCTYSVEEVLITDASGTISPVYGSFIYLDNTNTNSYIVAITNTLAYEKLAVKKVWTDRETDDHTGDSVTVKLTAYYSLNGEKTQVPDEWLATFIGGSTTVTLSSTNSWYQVFGYMPVYYTVGSTNYAITNFEIEETSVTVDNGETYTTTCSGISTSKDASGNYYFIVTNAPQPKAYELSVKKTLSGNMYDPDGKFAFTVTYGDSTETFELGNNETKTITIPVGVAVSVTEAAGGYTYSLTSVEPSALNYTELSNGISFTMPTNDVNVEINNKKEIKIDTGVFLDTLPYILILAAVAVGVVLLLGRRGSREDD